MAFPKGKPHPNKGKKTGKPAWNKGKTNVEIYGAEKAAKLLAKNPFRTENQLGKPNLFLTGRPSPLKGRSTFRKGKTEIELYGQEKAKQLSEQRRQRRLGVGLTQETREKQKAWWKANFPNMTHETWSKEVKKRDSFTCRSCLKQHSSGKGLHAHHIKSWELYPELRFEVSNGKALCADCHKALEAQIRRQNARIVKEICEHLPTFVKDHVCEFTEWIQTLVKDVIE